MMTDIFTTIINITTSHKQNQILSIKINVSVVGQSKDIMNKFMKFYFDL